jgi:putative transcriptional regulator
MTDANSLTGKLLIAMPGMPDPRFAHSVVFLCAHSDEGAMGLIVNKPLPDLNFGTLLQTLDVPLQGAHSGLGDAPVQADDPVFFGGPVETSRGFVLHTPDVFVTDASLSVTEFASLSTSMDILAQIARGQGPAEVRLALGYSGWGPDQLDDELRAGGWLTCPAESSLLYQTPPDRIWGAALDSIGVDPRLLSSTPGRA